MLKLKYEKAFILVLFILFNQLFVFATQTTEYLADIYSKEYNSKVIIN